ncbi:C69 family dipeptidase [Microbacterium sp. p3-SID336]|uniref:C69 family dipeptidase n=1 Tax=Microbacterium sp. p3-SID336 TaxID=2916212 RepID=UPI0021A94151|nr:C69 family dipeptidase [Microbacterium sp. p3-SID336]MCT1478674.1 C69 family dipeptidase [Microbacterium sp. p3-SID336]
MTPATETWAPAWSCDSIVATPAGSSTGRTIFGKNSDRPAGESQPLRLRPARNAGAPLALAQLVIDDAPASAHIGSAPFWCWGYESGVNEHRVAIGNEALFTTPLRAAIAAARDGEEPAPGVLGMELVRLGLERARTAREAVDVITALLEKHGQWGSGKFGESAITGAYDNAFLIADPQEAWILETAGREWAARRADAVDSISNEISIRRDAELQSEHAAREAAAHGYTATAELDFAAAFTDPLVPLQVSHIRRARSRDLLERARLAGGVDIDHMRGILRDHLEDSFLGGPTFDAASPDFLTLCMHEAPSGFTWGNTASSMIVELSPDPDALDVVWWAAATPCTTAYIPVFPDASLAGGLSLPGERAAMPPHQYRQDLFDPRSYWWRTQRALDSARLSGRFGAAQQALRAHLDPVERDATQRVAELQSARAREGATETLRRRCAALTADVVRAVDAATEAALTETGIAVQVDPRWRP